MNINKIVLLLMEKQKRKILLSICKNKNVCKIFGHSRWIYQEIRASNNMAKDCVNIIFFFFLFQLYILFVADPLCAQSRKYWDSIF